MFTRQLFSEMLGGRDNSSDEIPVFAWVIRCMARNQTVCFGRWQKPNDVLHTLCGIIYDAMFSNERRHAMPDLRAEKIIIHFGMDKTGSTSIRASLSKHLTDSKFHYVTLGIANASRGLAAAFKKDPTSFPYFRNSRLTDEQLRNLKTEAFHDLAKELQKAIGKTAIMSAEAVSRFKESEFRALCSFISRQTQSIEAVGYVRRPKEYMESNLQQQIKGNFSKRLVPEKLFSGYRQRFEKFDTVLGHENVRLWLFDPKLFTENCVVMDFCAHLGIEFQKKNVIRINEGLSLPALSLLFAYRKYGNGDVPGPSLVKENSVLVKQLQKLTGPKLRLHSSLATPVIRTYQEGISWMEERLGASLAENLTEHDEYAIRSEDDLLKFSPDSLQWLAEQLGSDYVKKAHPRMTPQEVAKWMEILRKRLVSKESGRTTSEPKAGVATSPALG